MKHKNNAYSVLNGSITNVATAITLATGTGSRFPTDNFKVTLIGYDGNGNENAWEICLCTSRTGDILTVQRGQEGTTAVAWANATRIENRVTADTLDSTLEPTITAGTTSQYWRGDKTWRDFFTDVRAATLTGLSTATNAVITATDTVLSALGKLQKQVSDNLTTLTTHTGNTSNPHSTTAAQVGAVALTGNETVAGIKTFSSTITGSISGNAGTATALQTARTINGTSFNGSANIVVDPQVDSDDTTNASHYLVFVASSTAGYQRLKEDSSLSYNPSTNTLTVASLAGNASSATTAAACSGNAATATALETARTINGTSFNGSANITTSSWGTSRTITIGSTGKAVNGSANVSWTLAEIGAIPAAGGTVTGTLNITGGANITGPLSTSTALASRLSFVSETANGSTDVSAIPNGTSTRSSWTAINSSDTTNHGFFSFLALATDMRLWSGKSGTGTALPMTFYTDNSERMRIEADGTIKDGNGLELGWKTLPQNSQSLAYTLVASDAGKHILHPSADTTARTFTIPSNASVAYQIGTAITFVNQNGAGALTIAITTDTMRLAGTGATGSRTLAANGIATALKVTATEWIISGTGLT